MNAENEELLREILKWATGNPDIRAVLMTGSGARDDDSMDADSDLELR